MTQRNKSCPSDSALQAIVDGAFTSSISNHIDQCPECQTKLNQLDDDQLFEDLIRVRNQIEVDLSPARPSDLQAFIKELEKKGYYLDSEIYRGGQATVFKATQVTTRRYVAVKKLDLKEQLNVEQRLRFEREIEIISRLKHPNIVTIFDRGTAAGCPYFVMELVDGHPLAIHETTSEDVALSSKSQIREKLKLVRKICGAIQHAHRHGIIHRDLKPKNILVDSQGNPRVLDFGLAKLIDEKPMELTQTGQFLGTLAYASPEQLQFAPDQVDIRSDVYSLGVILYEQLTGRLPYRVDDTISSTMSQILHASPVKASQINASVDQDLDTILLKAMSKSPDRRYQTVAQFERDIGSYLTGFPIEARRDSRLYVLKKSIQRNKTIFAAAVISLLVMLCSLIVAIIFWNDALNERDVARNAVTSEKTAKQDAELNSNVANIVAAKGAVAIGDAAEAKRRLGKVAPSFRDWEWHYWSRRADESLATLKFHQLYIRDFELVPDKEQVVSISGDGQLYLWSLQNYTVLNDRKLQNQPHSIAIAPDGTRIGLAEFETIRVLDADLNEILTRKLEYQVRDLLFSHDSRFIIFCGRHRESGTFRIVQWNLSQDTLSEIPGDWPELASIDLHPKDRLVAIAGEQSGVLNLDSNEFSQLDLSGSSHFVKFHPDGQHLVFAFGWSANVVDTKSLKTLGQLDVGGPISHASFLDAEHLSISGKGIQIWNFVSNQQNRVLLGHDQMVNKSIPLIGSSQLLSASKDSTFKLWNPSSSSNPLTLFHHEQAVRGIDFSPTHDLIATASEDGRVALLDSKGAVQRVLEHDSPVFAVAFSPTHPMIATGSDDGQIRLWDLAGGPPRSFNAHTDRIHSLDFDTSGTRIVSASRDKTVKVWNVSSSQPLVVFDEHAQCVHNAKFTPCGNWIVSRCHDAIKTWNAESGTQQMTVNQRMGAEDYSLVFIPGKNQLAAGTSIVGYGKGFTTFIDIMSGEINATLEQHNSPITAVDFNPSGTRAITASVDSLKIWDLKSLRDIVRLDGVDDPIYCIRFSPDGKRVFAGCRSGKIMVWNAYGDFVPKTE